MATDDPRYLAIIGICQESQRILDVRQQEVGVETALAEGEPYDSMWRGYFSDQGAEPVQLRHANFSGLLFMHARFERHSFIDCDFSGSRWFFSFMKDSNCAGSNFSGIRAILHPFTNTNCSGCDFAGAEIEFFDPFGKNNCQNANFTDAKLKTSHSFFKDERLPSRTRFENAVMNGCRLTIRTEQQPQWNRTRKELRSLLDSLFSPDQLAVMQIDYGAAGCFIATAACGINSEEVAVLRHFRDTALLNSPLGRLLVGAYYRVSPPLASLIESSPRMRSVVRSVLVRPIARLVDRRNP